jgi:hypothetical protein
MALTELGASQIRHAAARTAHRRHRGAPAAGRAAAHRDRPAARPRGRPGSDLRPGHPPPVQQRARHRTGQDALPWTEVNPEYQADPRDFTDADIAAGKLREADDADTAQNRAIVRRVLEAAFPDAWLPDDVRELLTDLAQGGYADADVTMLASQLLAKYSQQAGHG